MAPVNRKVWKPEEMTAALNKIRRGQLSVRAASIKHGIPRRTLRDYLNENVTERRAPGRPPVLSEKDEEDLKERIFKLSSYGFPRHPKSIRRAVFRFADEHGIPNLFNAKNRRAGKNEIRMKQILSASLSTS